MVVGLWHWYHYEEAFSIGMEKNGVTVIRLPLSNYFESVWSRFYLVLPFPGIKLVTLNFKVVLNALIKRPDVVLFWLPTVIFPLTLWVLGKCRIKTITYNNDNPFVKRKSFSFLKNYQWFWYHRCLKFANFNFFYRSENVLESVKYSANNPKVLLPYYIPWRDFPITLNSEEKDIFSSDIVFIGHYENDGRDKFVLALLENGFNLRIWGGEAWNRNVLLNFYDKLKPIRSVEGVDYTKALCGSKICLAFLSKFNRDTYTRRCFEIPACGRLMLAERTDDLLSMFKEDEEACFFSTPEELVLKVRYLLDNPLKCDEIARAGLNRVQRDNHDVYSRAKEFLKLISKN